MDLRRCNLSNVDGLVRYVNRSRSAATLIDTPLAESYAAVGAAAAHTIVVRLTSKRLSPDTSALSSGDDVQQERRIGSPHRIARLFGEIFAFDIEQLRAILVPLNG